MSARARRGADVADGARFACAAAQFPQAQFPQAATIAFLACSRIASASESE